MELLIVMMEEIAGLKAEFDLQNPPSAACSSPGDYNQCHITIKNIAHCVIMVMFNPRQDTNKVLISLLFYL